MKLLKEFDLKISGDKARKRTFGLQVRCITALYERLFPAFETQDCWKILINCVGDSPKIGYRNLLGVYELDVLADVELFFSLADAEKRRWAFQILQLGITNLLKQTSWEAEPFITTFKRMEDLNLQNVWIWKTVRSSSQNLIAEVWIEHNVQSCAINLVVRDLSGQEVKQQTLITELPDEWAYARHLGSLAWESDTRVVLKNKEKSQIWYLEL